MVPLANLKIKIFFFSYRQYTNLVMSNFSFNIYNDFHLVFYLAIYLHLSHLFFSGHLKIITTWKLLLAEF